MAQGLQVDLPGRLAPEVLSGGGILLVAGHAGDGVVQDNHRGVAPVIGNICNAGDARVGEGGVADHRHAVLLVLRAAGQVKAMEAGTGRAHADVQIQGVEGGHDPKGVAADIPVDHALIFGQGVEHTPVGTSGAHHRGTAGDVVLQGQGGLGVPAQTLGNAALGQLVHQGNDLLAGDVHADPAAVGLDDGLQLFHHQNLVHLGSEGLDLLHRHGPGQAQLQDAGLLPKDLPHILVAGGGGDDAQGSVSPQLHPVQVRGLGQLRHGPGALLHPVVGFQRVGGHHDPLRVFLIGLFGHLCALSLHHNALGVGDAGAHTHQDRGVVFLRELEGPLGKVQGFLGVRGLQHGDLGGHGVVAGILLVLGGEHARVIGHADDQASLHPLVGNGEEGVCRHVQAHMLHAAGRPLAAHRRPVGNLQGHLFVGGPFAVDLRVLGGFLRDLRAGGAGVAGDHAAPGLIQSAGNRLVAQHQFFHSVLRGVFLCQPWLWGASPSSWATRSMISARVPVP